MEVSLRCKHKSAGKLFDQFYIDKRMTKMYYISKHEDKSRET